MHGGGVPGLVELLESLESAPYAEVVLERERSWVMFDSDQIIRDRYGPDIPKLRSLCRRLLRGRFWCLERRSIESYLPIAALERHLRAELRRVRQEEHTSISICERRLICLSAFKKLTPDQRHFYHMKKGMDGDAGREDRASAEPLWASVDEATRADLRSGFGRHVSAAFRDMSAEEWDREVADEAHAAISNLLKLL